MLFEECYTCPFNMYRFCNQYCTFNQSQYINSLGDQFRDFNDTIDYNPSHSYNYMLEQLPLDATEEDYYLEGVRAPQGEVNRLVGLLAARQSNIFTELNNYGINRRTATYLFRLAIGYVIDNEQKYSGNLSQKINAILRDFENTYRSVLQTFLASGIPRNKLNDILRTVIRFTLNNLRRPPTPAPIPPTSGWSRWEDLGGNLNSGPGVASWQPNRLDVFSSGTGNALYHKWWDASKWSNFENLGGVLTSSPDAVSWGRNRIDVFGRGTDNAMYHKWWNGSNWSNWESLGGILTSAPAVASWSENRLDTFVRGTDNQLYHKWWNGSKWSDWEALGGVLTSGPAAVSWGPNRIDVFARGQNNAMWHIWWDGSKWSKWEDLGGNLTSDPAASSRGTNKIDCFARGRNNELIYKSWNGTKWSEWQGLGGVLTSEPAAVSWGANRIDVFARGQNNHLWHIWRDFR